MIRVSDYIAQRLAEWGVEHVFLLTGGGAMFLNDAFARAERIRPISNHHEQACAMAAEGYARITGKPGVINVTTGPGGINALNGVFGAWTDSVPMLILSGQVKRETCMASYDLPGLRQLGDQEVDIISMVRGITKYAEMVMEPRCIRHQLEKAWYLATNGRPGPCWLDIPVDVQSAMVEEAALAPYDSYPDQLRWDRAGVEQQASEVIARMARSPRPVILAGSGVRIAGAVDLFQEVAEKLGAPVTTAWTHDLIASDHPLFCGRPGTIGGRAGNFTVQNAETLLILGSRLNIRQVSYNWQSFARGAFKIQVDVDAAELNKPTVRAEMPVHCDLRMFLEEMNRQLTGNPIDHGDWVAWCKERVARYSALDGKTRGVARLNPYHFVHELFQALDDDDAVVCGNATACIVPYQTARLRKGQRLISNSGAASMGHDLPCAIGAAAARGGKRVICLAGDGSLQLNIQELQTLVHYRLPVKLFVLNNGGYLSIRGTQDSFFGKRIGESPESGVSFPDAIKLAGAYGIPSIRIWPENCAEAIREALRADGAFVCDVMLDPDQRFEPRLASRRLPDGRMVSSPLEDMFPFLDREELKENLLIPPVEM
ncbi:MAG TPA: thiamine pyrophosphate-binding protein [Bryobacteraceae bacterium]|nr:thiamine pyrophosphate-binding protein [Bryobacteraceae bacterium]